VVAPRLVQRRQRGTDRTAMLGPHAAGPDAGQERRDRGVPFAQLAQRSAVAPMHRQRANDAAPGQMLHQSEEPWQFRRIDPFFV
jgi:hypothetical protein